MGLRAGGKALNTKLPARASHGHQHRTRETRRVLPLVLAAIYPVWGKPLKPKLLNPQLLNPKPQTPEPLNS